MKYFDEKMNSIQSRLRYFDLTLYNPVPREEQEAVEAEYRQMIKINIQQESALAAAGWMC